MGLSGQSATRGRGQGADWQDGGPSASGLDSQESIQRLPEFPELCFRGTTRPSTVMGKTNGFLCDLHTSVLDRLGYNVTMKLVGEIKTISPEQERTDLDTM